MSLISRMRFALALLVIALSLPACASSPPKTPTPQVMADAFFVGCAYVDTNGNGQLDDGDQPLKGAFFVPGPLVGGRTGSDGCATAVAPGGMPPDLYPLTATMLAPPDSDYALLSPRQVTVTAGGPTHMDFLFTRPSGAP